MNGHSIENLSGYHEDSPVVLLAYSMVYASAEGTVSLFTRESAVPNENGFAINDETSYRGSKLGTRAYSTSGKL